ncbi:MAG: bifunctional hydroxymethylpyrimidine kinase/phosphomethylpyrimidine kinase [Corynebacterium casei]|uniref:bifunctional hydroxymethylpyrimidine kinase/phosphomethylpyrimidine kinase n=1 Tax=Corynebacterium casei TaxID=160386 RepID=UPI0012DD8664|nr:bifunctional hydroxymethylpyrimidine kinase/phosphomethylpyrimidine kinase [Corynebacterium casei]MDN5923091.1 bifunctional hydroxymethylpyrimidine kinase/phosphomethylpyrimidine kinase [Corynebacterium casei]
MKRRQALIPNVLTIAGTDPTGGAGIQADLKAFSANGAYGMSVVTAVVAQNTRGVGSIVAMEPEFVAEQIAAVFEDVRVDAVKIGMVANADIADAIRQSLDTYAQCPVVLDPVMVAKSGDHLMQQDDVEAIRERLVPRATLITPNLPEASVLLDRDVEMSSLEEMHASLEELRALGSQWVLLKGGHLGGEESIDILTGHETVELTAPRVDTINDHGTGCTLSAAIAALLPRHGYIDAVRQAKKYLTAALRHADELDVGAGHGPVHHFHALWNNAPLQLQGAQR